MVKPPPFEILGDGSLLVQGRVVGFFDTYYLDKNGFVELHLDSAKEDAPFAKIVFSDRPTLSVNTGSCDEIAADPNSDFARSFRAK